MQAIGGKAQKGGRGRVIPSPSGVQKLRLTPNQVFLLYLLSESGPVESSDKLQLALLLAQKKSGTSFYEFGAWLTAPRSGELSQDVRFLRYQGLLLPDRLAVTPLAQGVLADARRQYRNLPMEEVVQAFLEVLPLPLEEISRRIEEETS